MNRDRPSAPQVLWLLFAINTLNFFDRQILAAVSEPIRKEWILSDLQIGWLGTAFILLYAVAGIPLGRLVDSRHRMRLLGSGLAFWSLLTTASAFSGGFWSFFWIRLGMGAGEAVCAPACTSIIGDLFPSSRRGRALSIYMLGLPLGIALSYLLSSAIAQHYGWRSAYIAAGIPGLFLAVFAALQPEPQRGTSEISAVGHARRPGSPYLLILRIPTFWWIVVSGVLHNFNLYALSYFLPALLIRYHKTTVQNAGLVSSIVVGIIGGIGMVVGGWMGDRLSRRRPDGRMILTSAAVLLSVPFTFLALRRGPGEVVGFLFLLGIAWMLMYAYYSNIYSTIQDILEPSMRGTGMAIYFFAMYALGAFLGPIATGWASDWLAARAAANMGVGGRIGEPVAEQFKAIGLHQAMYMIPVLGLGLAAILFAGCRTVQRDIENLRAWEAQFQ